MALQDLDAVLRWGVESWGTENAEKWLENLQNHVKTRLSEMPTAYPTAPETTDFDLEVRQLIYGRYRILFTIASDEVLVLRVRGPYTLSAEGS